MKTRHKVLALNIHHYRFNEALQALLNHALDKRAGFACFVNAHMSVEAVQSPAFATALNQADYLFADGVPVAKMVKWTSGQEQERVAGMDVLPALLSFANTQNQPLRIGIYGGHQAHIDACILRIEKEFPLHMVAVAISPPFRQLTEEEQQHHLQQIESANLHVLFVALGCPKQEWWMHKHKLQVPCLMLGLGGAIPVFAGVQKRAPQWLCSLGLEWAYRLLLEPKRLFKRYFLTNSLFIWHSIGQLIRKK